MRERRAFLRQLALAAVVVAGGGASLPRLKAQEDAPSPPAPISDPLRYANFAPLVDAEFSVIDADADGQTLKLVAATLKPRGPEFENFSLDFEGAEDRPLEDRIRRLQHPDLGEFEIFISRLKPREGCQRYYAVVYRTL
jgi:hypothetical protein